MSSQDPSFITFNVEQWRRDIQSFASDTRNTLDEIVSDLSNQCSSRTASRSQSGETEPASSIDLSYHRSMRPRLTSDEQVAEDDSGRLSQLKAKLAQRLRKQ